MGYDRFGEPYEITLDFYNKKVVTVDAKQYDELSRYILVTCTNQGSIFHLDADHHSVFVRYLKADEYAVFNQCEIVDGKILVELSEQMLAAAGTCVADVLVINSGALTTDKGIPIATSDGKILQVTKHGIISTMKFIVNVISTPFHNSEIESSYEFDALNKLLDKALSDYNYVLEHVGDIEENVKKAETSATNASKSEKNAKASETEADKSKSAAATSAAEAKKSETAAKGSADSASASKTAASASQTAAAKSATSAQSSATAASTSATQANSAKDAANTSAQNAQKSATQASASQTAAQKSQEAAAGSASAAEKAKTAAETASASAGTSKAEAATSASNAAASASTANAAKTAAEKAKTEAEKASASATASASEAEGYKEDAAGSADDAASSAASATASKNAAEKAKTDAEASKTAAAKSESNASTSATNAKTSETKAEESKNSAAQSASKASASEQAASESANSASESADAAEKSAENAAKYESTFKEYNDLAKSYAVGTDGVTRQDDEYDNAKYYSELAKSAVKYAESTLTPMGNLSSHDMFNDHARRIPGCMYNITDPFTTTDMFLEGAGHKYPAGTNVYYVDDYVLCANDGTPLATNDGVLLGGDGKWDVFTGIQDETQKDIADLKELTKNLMELFQKLLNDFGSIQTKLTGLQATVDTLDSDYEEIQGKIDAFEELEGKIILFD